MGSATPHRPASDEGGSWLVCETDGSPRPGLVGPEADRLLARLTDLVRSALEDRRGPRPTVIGLRFVEPDQMAELNRSHLGHDGPTDVLSFPIDGDPADGATTQDGAAIDQPPWMLGDIVICPQVAGANAPLHAGSYDDELALLVVHGLLHLLGMDHADDHERAAMQARERDLLDRFHGPLVRDPWIGAQP